MNKPTYQKFTRMIRRMLVDGDLMDDQLINDFYTAYRESQMKYSMREWIKFWFADWTLDKNGFELKEKGMSRPRIYKN